MSNERHVLTPNSATSVSCLPMTPLLKPFAGDATVEVTVNRDTSYTGPYTVQIRREGSTIASTTLATPDEEETISLNIPSTQLTGCELKLEACVRTFVSVPCCSEPVPASLVARLESVSECDCANGVSVTLTYDPLSQMWIGTKVICEYPGGADQWRLELGCSDECSGGWFLQITGCEGDWQCATSGACSPMSLEFNSISPWLCCGGFQIDGIVKVIVTEQ